MKLIKQKLKDIFETTYDGGSQWNGSISNIDYYSLSCRAATNNELHNLKDCNVCMFKCNYEDDEAILIVFSLPITLEGRDSKHISDRIMDTIQLLEETFVFVDYMNSMEVKEDRFVYLTAIKKVK